MRRADSARFGGDRVIEFGLAVDKTFSHPYQLDVDLFLDLDRNGTDDVRLRGRDWTDVQAGGVLGVYLTTQQPLPTGPGSLDWAVSTYDFNDRVIILPFSMVGSGGLVPDSFNYRLEVVDGDGNRDVQTGSVDLGREIVPDLNSFGLERGDRVNIGVTGGEGQMLWLFPNDHDWVQDWTVWATPGGPH